MRLSAARPPARALACACACACALASPRAPADMGQALPGQSDTRPLDLAGVEGGSPFISEGIREALVPTEGEGSSFAVGVGDVLEDGAGILKDEPTDPSHRALPSTGEPGAYWEADDAGRFRRISRRGTWGMGFAYVRDTFDYGGSFDRVFTDDDDRKGHFLFASHRYPAKWGADLPLGMDLLWGVEAGLGYNNARTRFANGVESEEDDIVLWTVPVSLLLGLEVPVGRWLRLGVRGGPSAMGLIQNRGDKSYGTEEKERRQVGRGLVAEGRLSLSFGAWSKSGQVRRFGESGMTDMRLDLVARSQSYGGFKENSLEIAGSSLGIGLSADFL